MEKDEKTSVSVRVEDPDYLEKENVASLEQVPSDAKLPSSLEVDAAYAKRVVRKLDIRIVLFIGVLYSIAMVDRTNLASARVGGLAKDLHL